MNPVSAPLLATGSLNASHGTDREKLAGAANAFENGGLVNFQIQFSRSRTALPITRDYMFEGERKLRGY